MPDAAPLAVAAVVIDARAIDLASPPAPIDAPAAVDARARKPPPDAPVWDDFPDELDQRLIDKVNAGLRRKFAACGDWTDADGYSATFHIGMDGRVTGLQMTGPQPNITACMMRILLGARYGYAKHGLDYDMPITR
jgi:hypothetical protein